MEGGREGERDGGSEGKKEGHQEDPWYLMTVKKKCHGAIKHFPSQNVTSSAAEH